MRSRTVQPRYHGSGSDDNQLLSIVRIFIKVLTDEQYQEVKEGEKINPVIFRCPNFDKPKGLPGLPIPAPLSIKIV